MTLARQRVRGALAATFVLLWVLAPGAACAEATRLGNVPGEEIVEMQWRFLAGGGGSHQFKTGVDGGGHVSVSDGDLGIGGRLRLNRALSLRLQLGYEYASYDFSGSKGLAGLDPWDDVHTVGLTSTLSMKLGDHWRPYAGFKVKASAESGADFGDAITVGGLAGVSYRWSDRLSLGAGFTISQRLENDPSVSPLVSVIWSIIDDLTLRVGSVGAVGDTAGGVELEWRALPEVEVAVGIRNRSRRFRLDDRGVAPDGVGRDRSRPVYARVAWKILRNVEMSAMGGAAVTGNVRISDRHGDKVRDEDYDPAPFASLHLAVGF